MEWLQIRIGKPWMPIPIRQNDANPTGYTTLLAAGLTDLFVPRGFLP